MYRYSVAGVLINYTHSHQKVRRAVLRELNVSPEAMNFIAELSSRAKRHAERLAEKGAAAAADEERGGAAGGALATKF